jgi:hypothetical protein
MTSDQQTAANRANAMLSTGPRTPEGKQRSAANSTRHALSGRPAVLPQENADEFQQLQTDYFDQFSPQNPHESFLVEQMIHARWRIARIQRLELRLLSDAASEAAAEEAEADPADADAAILDHMHHKGVDLPTALQRYLNSAERSYYKAHHELTAARAVASQTQAAEARTEAAEARRESAELEKALMNYVYSPLPRPSTPVTLESEEPLSPPRAEPHNNATRQSLRAPAL